MPDTTASPPSRIFGIMMLLLLMPVLASCGAGRQVRPARETSATAVVTPVARASAATLPSSTASQAEQWPTADWPTADPGVHGVDAKRLDEMMDSTKEKELQILGVVVVRDGYVVYEQYGRNLGPHSRGEVYSVTKSFASTLLGIAKRKGLIADLDGKILARLPGAYSNIDARKQAMTLEDVLTMRSGLDWSDDDETLGRFYYASDPVKFVLDFPMAADPGTVFNYCSGCSHLLTEIVSEVTGRNAADFAEEELFGPLGIRGAYWIRDRNGIPLGGWGLSLTPREMAKLGYLYLRGGTWNGREVLTREWVETATAKHTTTDSANGYGYQWWTHPKFPAYMALGRFGQIIYVNSEKDLVLAMRANVPNHDPIYHLIETYLEPAVR